MVRLRQFDIAAGIAASVIAIAAPLVIAFAPVYRYTRELPGGATQSGYSSLFQIGIGAQAAVWLSVDCLLGVALLVFTIQSHGSQRLWWRFGMMINSLLLVAAGVLSLASIGWALIGAGTVGFVVASVETARG